MRRVAIIGGGISGLICIKCCLEDGLLPTCFEMTNDIGGLWNYDTNAIDGKASVMKSTVINTSKEFMAFSDYPAPIEYPNYMHNSKLLAYFRMYANKFDLAKYIRFQTRVTQVRRAHDYEQTGCWHIYSQSTNISNQQTTNDEICETYDAVMLATGHHAHPRWADFPGLANFKGEKLHSWQYKTSRGFEDKTVLIVGIGNSGGDIAVELGRVAKQVYLSTRRGTWIINRVGPNGWPSDMVQINEMTRLAQKYVPSVVDWVMEMLANSKLDHKLYNLKPAHHFFQQHPFINDDIANRIICGSVIVKPNVKEFMDNGHGVIFNDGSKVDNIDCVIMATGFNIVFPYLDNNILPINENRVRLYKYVWPVDLKHPTLAVMGLIQPWGAINPITELQARWATQIFKGKSRLPSKTIMNQDIDKKIEEMSKRYTASPRHTVQVDHFDHCNELADQIGCRPNIWKYLINDFQLGWQLLFGPCTPYRYRLEGPNPWEDARQAILTQFERVTYPLSQSDAKKRQNESIIGINSKTIILFLIILFISYIFYKIVY